jgi:uncharacterized protein (TIGR03437 family)
MELHIRRVPLLLVLAGAVAAAQTAGNWTQKTPATSPPARENHAVAYDSAHGQLVLFGGDVGLSTYFNDTWVFDGTKWTQKSPAKSPPPRSGHAMAYDSVHHQVLMFGGVSLNILYGTTQVFNDTWAWDGTNWTQQFSDISPQPRAGHAMAYDSANDRVVLFGGSPEDLTVGFDTLYNDTWLWDGTNWNWVGLIPSPSGRAGVAMAYDSAHGQTVLFGGNNQTNEELNDTWLWNGSAWTQKFPQTSPLVRISPGMAYDSAQSQVVMFGGSSVVGNLFTNDADTWVWNGTNWTQEQPATSPPGRTGPALAYDTVHSQVVAFGGVGVAFADLNDTWTWGAASSTGYSCSNTTPPVITSVDSASAYGGYDYFTSGSWLEIKGSNMADPADPRLAPGPNQGQWTSADFNGVNAPTVLDGISVSINGKPAYVWYLSTGQLNVQAPEDSATGTVAIAVTNCKATSPLFSFTRRALAPGFLAPANYTANGTQYMVATFQSDGAYVLNTTTGASFGLTSRPAKPGDGVIAYGIGFGEVTPTILPGVIVGQNNALVNPIALSFGMTPVTLAYSGLVGGFVGLYEFYFNVPSTLANGDYQINVTQNGTPVPQTMYLTVHN